MVYVGMFTPSENPGYDRLLQDATGLVAGWLSNEWYESSVEERLMIKDAPAA